MKNVFDELVSYAMGEKGHTHFKGNKLKENKNVTKVQDFLSEYVKSK